MRQRLLVYMTQTGGRVAHGTAVTLHSNASRTVREGTAQRLHQRFARWLRYLWNFAALPQDTLQTLQQFWPQLLLGYACAEATLIHNKM